MFFNFSPPKSGNSSDGGDKKPEDTQSDSVTEAKKPISNQEEEKKSPPSSVVFTQSPASPDTKDAKSNPVKDKTPPISQPPVETPSAMTLPALNPPTTFPNSPATASSTTAKTSALTQPVGSALAPSADSAPTQLAPPAPSTPSTPATTTPDSPVVPQILPIVPIREGVLFPSTESVLTFGRSIAVQAIQESMRQKNLVILLAQKKSSVDRPTQDDLYQVGTLAVVERTLNVDNQLNALVRGVSRIMVKDIVSLKPYLMGHYTELKDEAHKDEEFHILMNHLQKEFKKSVHMGKPVEFLNFMKLMSGVNDSELIDQIASTLNLSTAEKQGLLETLDVKERLKAVVKYLDKEINVLEIEKDVVSKTQEKFDKNMRENILRERLRTIQQELGEIDDEEEVLDEYQKKLKKVKLPVLAKEKVVREIKRLKQMSVNNPEGGYIRSWLDTVFELPWSTYTKGNIDLTKAENVLDKNHYGLKEVKDRIIEYIAVLKMKQQQSKPEHVPTILCFVGAPGVGKTSIGRSIAESLGRKFAKISLGGVRDEAEIRGHRRTYVGAMPGRIINGMKQAKSMNPVFMLDEIDKIGQDFRGDPAAALLEVLDPEQNASFEDHYVDMPFDLSQVIFITTANTLDTIPPALLDRLEVIRYAGYTRDEKFHIGKDHLLDKVRKANGLSGKHVGVTDTVLNMIIERYTKEAGVRNLERELNKVMRKIARQISEKSQKTVALTTTLIKKYLGPEKYDTTMAENKDEVGLSTGLAWTSVGGDVLFIEVALTPGKGDIKLTGQLGDVMKESAQAAFTYVQAHAKELHIPAERLAKTNIHIHVPEGAVPKDGPSAGITICTAIISAYTGRAVRREIAMTGEITLRGRVTRIGGLKEKSIAAHQAGIKTIIIPKDNLRDMVEIPDSVKETIKFIGVGDVSEVLKIAMHSA